MCTFIQWCDTGMDVRTWCISSGVCYGRIRLIVIWVDGWAMSVVVAGLEKLGVPCRCGGIVSSIAWGILSEERIYASGVIGNTSCISFHRWEKVFWWMRVYTKQPEHVTGVSIPLHGDVHTRQPFVGDLTNTRF